MYANKTYKISVIVILIITALLVSACVFPWSGPIVRAKATATRMAIEAQATAIIAAAQAEAGGHAPASTPEAPGAPAPIAAGCMNWTDFKALADGKSVYELIDLLDTQVLKKDHPEAEGKWRVTGDSVIWTGSYIDDPTYAGKAQYIAVDGKTGTWVIQGPVTILTPAGEICVSGYDGTMPGSTGVDLNRDGGTISASACVENDQVVDLFNQYKNSDPNRIYRGLDEMADKNPTARMRFGGQATVVAKNARTLVWAQSGTVSGPVLELDRTESKSIWLATSDGDLNMSYPFSGIMLCDSIIPARDFPWWGK